MSFFNSNSKGQVVLSFGEISMTGSQLQQSLQGGEGAKNLMIVLEQCLGAELISRCKRMFVSPLNKVKGHWFASKFKNLSLLFSPNCRTTKI